MALYTYGGTPSDVLTTTTGDVVPDRAVNIRSAGTGELITAIYEADGVTPIGTLRSNPASSSAPGAIRTFKIDGITAIEYEHLDAGGQPVRWYQAAREAATGALEQIEGKFDKTGGTLTGKAQVSVATAATVALASFVTGDTFDRWRLTADGKQAWGPGNAARDVTLERTGPGVLSVSGTLKADQIDLSGQRVYNALAYGAKGTGVVDDAASIQAALDAAYAAGGGIVLLPGGYTYGVGTFLVVKAKTTVWAYGATIRSIHANRGVLRNFMPEDSFTAFNGHSRIAIYGGIWDGNASNGAGSGLVTGTTNIACFIHCRDITVRDAVFLDTSSAHALEYNAVDGGRVLNCRFEGFRDNSGDGSRLSSEAIQIDIAKSGSSSIPAYDGTPCKNIVISGCWFGPSARLGAFGRAIGSHADVAGQYFENITVRDNVVEGALEVGIQGWCWRRAVISGNIIRGTANSGIYVSVPSPGTVYSAYGITISDNIIEGAQADSGIRVLGYDTAPITDVVISGNTVRGAAGTTANGIQAQGTPGAVIAANTIDGVQSTGIFPQYSDGVSLTGNTIRGASSNAVNVAGCTAASVTDNVIDTTGSNHGIVIGGGTDGRSGPSALVAGNRVRAAASAGIRVSQAGCHITGNKVIKGSGSTANGVSLTGTATDCTITDNDLSGNGWTTAAAIVTSTAAPVTGPGSMTALPGNNFVDVDLTPLPALEAAMSPAGRYETTSRLRAGGESQPSSGWLYLVPIWLPKGLTIANLTFVSGNTAAAALTNQWFTLHNSARVALARTADATNAAWAAATAKTLAIAQTTTGTASTFTTTYAGLHYLGVMIAGTTPPSLAGEGRLIAGGAAAPGLGATNSGQTTPPTVTSGAFTAVAFSGAAILAYAYTG
ncbi:right-handed parallel beta-helix repeat-containing protein [Streptomyces sp. NPDC056987]|uniref:right-handed parallel beta-helix repeat-containing protein n=1 Tax=Streptomyces sp. NPDC056987 TaxID=3345988 RepID=UPI003626F816